MIYIEVFQKSQVKVNMSKNKQCSCAYVVLCACVLEECVKVPLGGLMSKKRLNQMKRLWHILDCEKIWSAFGDVGVSKEVLSVRVLSLCDAEK